MAKQRKKKNSKLEKTEKNEPVQIPFMQHLDRFKLGKYWKSKPQTNSIKTHSSKTKTQKKDSIFRRTHYKETDGALFKIGIGLFDAIEARRELFGQDELPQLLVVDVGGLEGEPLRPCEPFLDRSAAGPFSDGNPVPHGRLQSLIPSLLLVLVSTAIFIGFRCWSFALFSLLFFSFVFSLSVWRVFSGREGGQSNTKYTTGEKV